MPLHQAALVYKLSHVLSGAVRTLPSCRASTRGCQFAQVVHEDAE